MYFSRELGDANTSDIYVTIRPSTTQPFTAPTPYANLNSATRDGRAFLTPDEQTLVLATNRDGPLNIYINTRVAPAPFGTPDGTYMAMVNAVGNDRTDPSLSPDRLRLYFSADTGLQGRLQLLIATRASATANFSTPSQIPGTLDNANHQGDPTLYSDEHLLLFSSFPTTGGDADVWYATRASAADSFGPPVRIPGVNTDNNSEFDAVLSADGCEVYFASNRRGGQYHLFHAKVTK
jgi:Tol biopolymer transport system component